ncbi:MAG TPA: hypothetical protein VJ847_10415 [Gemmatimonadales bacterium]|nr:hypothetical protein [Gemmatimonadales bacterium]
MTDPHAPIDRAALERILRRAAELQTSERDIGERLSPDEVLALGREVGIPGQYLQQAMVEERARVVPAAPSGVADRLAGPASTSAQRVVAGTQAEVTEALLAYMEAHELFCIQRQQPGRITWEPLGGFQATVRRSTAAFGSGKKPFMLSGAEVIAATLMPLEAGYVHVTLAADARHLRRNFLIGGVASLTVGVAAAAILGVLTPFIAVAVAPLPLAAGVGYGAVRQYHPKLERIQLGLERALDHLQQDGVRTPQLPAGRPGIVNLLADEVRKALRP